MSAYSREDERAMRAGHLVNDWIKSGLLAPEQREAIAPGLQVDLRRTNLFLRLTLFVFTVMILQSVAGVVAITFDIDSEEVASGLSLAAAIATFWLASFLVDRYRLYRFGVEEAAAVLSIGFSALGVALLAGVLFADTDAESIAAGLAGGAVAALVVFLKFGYRYAALASMVCLSLVPFQFGDSEFGRRTVAVVLLAASAAVFRRARAEHGDDQPGNTYAFLEAAAWVGVYLLLNLKISSPLNHVEPFSRFYWATYGAIWVLPAAGLWLGIRGRDRGLLDVSIAMALATLMSNKAYRGVEPNEWDPMVFGLFLMVTAIGLRRWLAAGENGERNGITPSRLLASDRGKIDMLGTASVAHPGTPVHTAPDDSIGGGGRSGGAGASSKF